MEYEALLGAFLTPVILFGLLGNILSMLVWVRGSQSKTSTAKYLSVLALVDATVLLFPASELWMFLIWRILLRDQNTVLCKLYTFLPYFGPQMSAWIVVFVTAERAISVWYPHRVRVLSTPCKAYLSMFILAACLIFVNSPLFVDTTVTINGEEDDQKVVDISETDVEYYVDRNDPRNNVTGAILKLCLPGKDSFIVRFKPIWDFWVQFLLLFSIPFFVITICNILIISKVILRRKYHNAMLCDSPEFGGRNTQLIGPITVRIIALSVVHCISSAPLTILVIDRARASQRGDYYLLRDVFNVLFYINNGINFVLYCVLGSGFRKDLLVLLCGATYRRRSSTGHSSV